MSTDTIELVPVKENEKILPITLPDSVEVAVGRTPSTNIVDLECSRKQVILKADYETGSVIVKREGKNPSILDGSVLQLHETLEAKDQMILELVPGKLQYRFTFSISRLLKNQRKRMASDVLEPAVPEKKPALGIKWKSCSHTKYNPNKKTLLICINDHRKPPPNEVAAFDMDGTIIKTKSGNVFPKNVDDWMLWHPSVKAKLEKLHKENKKIVIFTNQASLRLGTNTSPFQTKIEKVLKELNLPIDVFISREHDIFRKPAPGMWDHLEIEMGTKINKFGSFYVGDAAGRLAQASGKKKDFSAADRMFAHNLELTFFTPEEYFLNEPPTPFQEPKFNPKLLFSTPEPDFNITSSHCEGIVMVGSPASGKSFFVKKHLVPCNYTVINQDTLKTWSKCEELLKKCLAEKRPFVIDNTNPESERRKKITELCRKSNVPVRCFVMKTDQNHCLHNNRFRDIIGSDHAPVGNAIIKNFWRTFVDEPSKQEGFEAVIDVSFVPKFESEEHKELYHMHLIDS